MQYLAQGDFDQVLDMSADESEVGTMVASIETMKKNNKEMIGEISDVLGSMGDGNYNFRLQKTQSLGHPTWGTNTGIIVCLALISIFREHRLQQPALLPFLFCQHRCPQLFR